MLQRPRNKIGSGGVDFTNGAKRCIDGSRLVAGVAMRNLIGGVVLASASLATAPAHGEVAALRVGVMDHNVCVYNCKNAGKEDGPNIDVQVDFDSPNFLSWAFSPEPYLIASVNVAGDTSFYGGGLTWTLPVTDHWSVEGGLGYVLHDGETELPFENGTPEAAAFTEEHVLLGSRDLFRTSLSVARELPGPWRVEAHFMHVSHGQILGTGRNQGIDQLGVRLRYSFGE